jgi:hypothetical protein
MTRKFSDTVIARIAVDHPFTQALLVETQQELNQAHDALKMARQGLRVWKMDTSFIDAIIGPEGHIESQFSSENGADK